MTVVFFMSVFYLEPGKVFTNAVKYRYTRWIGAKVSSITHGSETMYPYCSHHFLLFSSTVIRSKLHFRAANFIHTIFTMHQNVGTFVPVDRHGATEPNRLALKP